MGKRKYINKKLIEEFTNPQKLPPEIEDEILDVFANYSIEQDMTTKDLSSYFEELRIPRTFLIGNKRINADELTIEGTDIIDFDKLMKISYQLIQFRENEEIIEETWNYLLLEVSADSKTSSINLQDLKKINENSKVGLADKLMLDMIAVGTDGQSVDIRMLDIAYILGKLGELN